MSFLAFICIYVLGGLTLLPILLGLIVLRVYFTFPQRLSSLPTHQVLADSLGDPQDDGKNIKSGKATACLSEKFQRSHEPDVAAGYFAVCREYVPGGVNGKPPERTTPAGALIAMESPSVYQSMYRSIFDRRQPPSLEAGKTSGRTMKKARNVFFVVLRHGHLMLYDDSEQLEVRHVISLEHHDVSIYGGDEEIPEGELWIKRNAISLVRKTEMDYQSPRSKPFYLFSENCSEKEDFYLALLQNQEVKPGAQNNPPRPEKYEIKHIIGLVQKLHSSEEDLQTRWINALIGRGFLALYKTPEVEDFIRKKLTKKMARVKKPAFLSDVEIRNISMGESAPFLTNPRLKDLTIDGDCCAEADIRYDGKFRLEMAATARIDLGTRFRTREVNLVLSVVVKKLQGHGIMRFKPPPSNRIWITFETMPEIELSIEPVVSTMHITYNIILRAIESRIREVVAETVVLPYWDDIPFTDTEHQQFRGGIWTKYNDSIPAPAQVSQPSTNLPEEDDLNRDSTVPSPTKSSFVDDEKVSTSISPDSKKIETSIGKPIASRKSFPMELSNRAALTALERREKPPKAIRSHSFAAAANPLVSLDNVNVELKKATTRTAKQQDAASAMIAISNRSQPTSPTETPFGSPPDPSSLLWKEGRGRSSSSNSSRPNSVEQNVPPISSSVSSHASLPTTPLKAKSRSPRPSNASIVEHEKNLQSGNQSSISVEKQHSMMALSAATVAGAAKKWGWHVLNRRSDQKQALDEDAKVGKAGTPEHPIVRGRPLPPPGQPLPLPERPSSKVSQNNITKRKPSTSASAEQSSQGEIKSGSVTSPTRSDRRRQKFEPDGVVDDEGMLVVEAPQDSEPASPTDNRSEEPTAPLKGSDNDKLSLTQQEDEGHNKRREPSTSRRPSSRQHSVSHENSGQTLGQHADHGQASGTQGISIKNKEPV